MTNKTVFLIILIVLSAVAAIIWLETKDASPQTSETTTEISPSDLPISISFNNLYPLDRGDYELWLVRADDNWSWGKFQTAIDGSGFAGGAKFNQIDVDPQDGDLIMITIEPAQDSSPQPSGIMVLVGHFGGVESAQASLRHPVDVSSAEGTYILGTPTNDPEAFETSGIWFTSPTGSAVSLTLPELVDGWIYEAWIKHRDQFLSSGRFESVDTVDDFDGYSGEQPGPNYPGEDFVRNLPAQFNQPLDLTDGASYIYISLEPNLGGSDPTDQSPTGYGSERLIAFLQAGIGADAIDHAVYPLEFTADYLPTGTASINN